MRQPRACTCANGVSDTSPSGMPGLLTDKSVLVTGASRGIGAAIAERCAAEGAGLFLTALPEDELQQVAERCQAAGAAGCVIEACDFTDPSAINRLAASVLEHTKEGVDVLINNAGVAAGKQDILTGDPDAWDTMLQINTLAPMRLTRLLRPGMAARGGGLVVNIGSLAGIVALPGSAPYCASKRGMRGWTLACYEELRLHNIRSLIVEPGFVATETIQQMGIFEPGLLTQPSDVAETVLLPLRMGPNANPLEVILHEVLSPDKE